MKPPHCNHKDTESASHSYINATMQFSASPSLALAEISASMLVIPYRRRAMHSMTGKEFLAPALQHSSSQITPTQTSYKAPHLDPLHPAERRFILAGKHAWTRARTRKNRSSFGCIYGVFKSGAL